MVLVGAYFGTTRRTAVKAYEFARGYATERDIYLRFAGEGLREIAGFSVPVIIDSDDTLKIVEMSFVNPPFCLDFAKCYLDRRPDFSAEVLAETRAAQRELFDEDQWSKVLLVMHRLEQFGVYSYDARPSNIAFLMDDS